MELKQKVRKAWVNYGNVICSSFNLKGHLIESEHIEQLIQENDEGKLNNLLDYISSQIEQLKSME